MGIEFVEDDQAVEAVDRWGNHRWIVGQTVEPAYKDGVNWVWTVNDKGEFGGVHPNSISILVQQEKKNVDLVFLG